MLKKVVLDARATLGTASGGGWGSVWACLDVNLENLVEMASAANLQKSTLAHVAVTSCGEYTGKFNMFSAWCEAVAEPKVSLPPSDAMVALYLQAVINGAKTLAPVKAASAAVAFYQKINLFNQEPTQSPAACLMRSAAVRRFGMNVKNHKEPFEWEQATTY